MQTTELDAEKEEGERIQRVRIVEQKRIKEEQQRRLTEKKEKIATWWKRHWWKITVVIIAILIGYRIISYLNSDTYAYKRAMKFAESGDYESAISMFVQLGDYRNSETMIREVLFSSTYPNSSFPMNSIPGPLANMTFSFIPSGEFMMGSPSSEEDRDSDEKQHRVSIDSFELMTTEVTQGMWEVVMGTSIQNQQDHAVNDLTFVGCGYSYPMYYVSWNECKHFINKLNNIDPNHTYRLPTESEWEYACRAGTSTPYYWGYGNSEGIIAPYCWCSTNSHHSTHPVAEKQPNSWGLYDMSGNVSEWCEDWYTEDYDDCPANGTAYRTNSITRVYRGGAWSSYTGNYRSAIRYRNDSDNYHNALGFRLARSVR